MITPSVVETDRPLNDSRNTFKVSWCFKWHRHAEGSCDGGRPSVVCDHFSVTCMEELEPGSSGRVRADASV